MMKKYPYQDPSLSFAERAKDLVSRLTLEEKAGQLTSHMEEIPRLGIKSCRIGLEIARGMVSRDPMDYRVGYPTTILPQPYGMAAMFDDALMQQLGELAGDEVRGSVNSDAVPASLYLFGPTVDMERDPRWGRNEEAYGEDPCLAARMNIAYTRGLAGEDSRYWKTIPILKHFYANNYEEERRTSNSNIPVRLKQEYYLKVFRDIVKKGRAPGLMTAYNLINGVEGVNNPIIWNECKPDWGLKLAVSDGGDFNQNVTEHRTFHTHAESIGAILGKGADLMLDGNEMVKPAVLEALRDGLLREEDMDRAIASAFEVRFMTGEFDDPEGNPYAALTSDCVRTPEHLALAEKAARESVILLKNNGLLPLDEAKTGTVAVVGPLSNENYHCWYCGHATDEIPVVEGFRRRLGAERVLFDECFDRVAIRSRKTGKYLSVKEDGRCVADADTISDSELFELADWDFGACTLRSVKTRKYLADSMADMVSAPVACTSEIAYGWFVREMFYVTPCEEGVQLKTWRKTDVRTAADGNLFSSVSGAFGDELFFEVETVSRGADRAAALAEKADAVIVAAGNHPLIVAREEYDRPDIRLPRSQKAILDAAAAANGNTVLYLVSGYPYSIVEEEKTAAAVVHSTHIGPSLGDVAAATVFGENNPAGRCPTTWYRSCRDLPGIGDYDIMKNHTTYLYYQGEPLYPFGYGLSYTSFAYRDMQVREENGALVATLVVENTGKYDGDEVVQLYVAPPACPFTRPERELKDFRRIHLKAGESMMVELRVPVSELAFYNPDVQGFTVQKGTYRLQAGASSRDIRCECAYDVDGMEITGKCAERWINALEADDYNGVEFLTDRTDNREYFLAEDFQGFAIYRNLCLDGCTSFEALLSTPAGGAELKIVDQATGEELGSCRIPTTGSLSRFVSCVCPIRPVEGLHDVRLQFTRTTSVKDFRFL